MVKSQYKTLSTSKAELIHLRPHQHSYESAEKPSRLLALRLKQSEQLVSIDVIKTRLVFSAL